MTSKTVAPAGAVLIPLAGGKCAIVDEADADLMGRHRWYTTPWGYAATKVGGKHVFMHRMLSDPAAPEIDHANRDKLDNRRSNLRTATRQENSCNAVKPIGMSGYRGVRTVGNAGLWRAMIKAKGEVLDLGYYEDVERAARVYDAAAKVFHGKFAVTNKSLGLLP